MNASRPLRVLPASPPPPDRPQGRFGPDDCYPGAVWLPALGPASYLAWRLLSRRLARQPDGLTTSLAELAVDLGLGSPHGSQAAVRRTLRRLERFGLLRWAGDDLAVLRGRLPLVSPAQLSRLHPSIQARHDVLRRRTDAQPC